MKNYTKPYLNVTEFDSEDVMKVSSANINGDNIQQSTAINKITQWHK